MTPFEQAILTALEKRPVFIEDRKPELAAAKAEQRTGVARAIAKASVKPPAPVGSKDWAAMLITIADEETHFSLRIHRGECFKWECDPRLGRGGIVLEHRARGPWQNQRNDHTAPFWEKMFGLEFVETQAAVASAMLGRGYWTCNPAKTGMHWVAATINGYAGKRCTSADWDGLGNRLFTFSVVRRQLG